jgi:hypothetical protein
MTRSFRVYVQAPARVVRWKNLVCPLCGIWIDRALIVGHTQSPLHRRLQHARDEQRKAAAV